MKKALFGTKKTPPSMDHANEVLQTKIDHLELQIAKCDEELGVFKKQLQQSRGNSSIKTRALTVLKRRKLYEQQRDQLIGSQMTMENVDLTNQQFETTRITAENLKYSVKAIKGQMNKIKIDEIEKAQDDLQDLMMDAEEINEIMSRSYALPDSVDDESLEAEFALLEDEVANETFDQASVTIPSYLPDLKPRPPGNTAVMEQTDI
eukprot:GHVL01026909.1.p1 GENE.GHVL01026909.1~~GHVL01026909.1.p1  ORF type:complete len:216 (-),score=53.20 GHVL01026909.1:322-939(-)